MCVFVVSVAAAYRLIGGGGEGPVFDTVSRKEWNELAETGRRLGAREAPVRVVVFVDYECPFCRTFEQNILSLMRDSIPQFSVSVHDFPLPSHPSAALAAGSSVAACRAAMSETGFADSVRSVAARFGVTGTPTVIIDRKQYRYPPSQDELRRLLVEGE
ncbi:MAG: DsbA family protein [Gemmatimonadaceae bacterium]|nr:DsbA family protein [Gemmatimonadaceae bacterium]